MDNLNTILSATLYVTTFVILIMAYFAFRKIKIPGAKSFGYLCIASSIYSFGYAFELMSTTVANADFWSKFQYLGIPFIPACWVALSIDYSSIRHKFSRTFFWLLFTLPLLTTIFRFTSATFGLQYGKMEMVSNGSFLVLNFDKGPWYYVQYLFFVFCALISIWNYFNLYKKSLGRMRRQASIMIIASLLPILALLTNIFKYIPAGIDSGPFFLILNYFVLLIGMVKYNFLNLIPLSREKVFSWIHDAVIVIDNDMRLIDSNDSAKIIFPNLRRIQTGEILKEIITDNLELIEKISKWNFDTSKCKLASNILSYEFEQIKANGDSLYYLTKASRLIEHNTPIGSVLIISDITATKELIGKLELMARIDSLTGLNNRRYFIERVSYEIERANRAKSSFSFIIFDLDEFKQINDTFGHLAGDEILISAAKLCLDQIRSIDILARYGGEEFTIFLPDTDKENAVLVSERIREAFENNEVIYCKHKINYQASFGVTTHDCCKVGDCLDFDQIIKSADIALYKAKASGRNQVIHFSDL